MLVCPRCKAENAEGRIRCGQCGNNISKRGEYSATQGPAVVVLGSVEDLRRARETGEIDTSNDDPDALGWLSSDEIEPEEAEAPKATRRVSVREIDKISGLRDLRDIQKALLEQEKTDASARDASAARAASNAPPSAPPARPSPHGKTAPLTRPVSSKSGPLPRPTATGSSTPPGGTPAPTVAFWLVGELLAAPVPLAAGGTYLLGREATASVVLRSAEVSRQQARIAPDAKGALCIEDLRSANGTYVNGRAISKKKLRAGDRIDLGPYRLEVLAPGESAPRVGAPTPDEETRVLRSMPGALTGEIETNGVIPVLVLLHSGKRSGVVTLRAGHQVGRIFLVDGEIHHATLGKAFGEEALAALLPAEGGSLHFADEKIQVKRSVTRATSEILG